eukprot:TRINITY_DN12281_c0_g1_i1.p1 TRINITY_DN12281_c0_g1~~TRINITY_DN12281_c0_g1_i1.p1  ORF type:complete len:942 (+),score=297.25 TRINITY_DN12281_c0_g1_i1:109-2826(+)
MPAGKAYIAVGRVPVARADRESLLEWARKTKRGNQACSQCTVSLDLADEQTYHIFQEWDSREHFMVYLKAGGWNPTPGGAEVPPSLFEARSFAAPGIKAGQDHKWAQAERKDLTKTDGHLFFLSMANRTVHGLFNNSLDQFDVTMTFPKQEMKPASDKVKQSDDADPTFKATVFPGETIPFVNGKWNGGYSVSYSWGPVSDENFLSERAGQMEEDTLREIDEFRQWLRDNGLDPGSEHGLEMRHTFQKKVLALCAQKRSQGGRKYIDLSFPPLRRSIDGQQGKPTRGWMRPERFLKEEYREKYQLFVGEGTGIDPGDIDQGALGDCWFMAAIAACAEHPDELIKPLYITSNYKGRTYDEVKRQANVRGREVGGWKVRLAKNGWWRWHIIDSYLPVQPVQEPQASVFAKNKEQPDEMWVAALEKAYAKLHGNYQELAGGDPAVALSDLTGFPCITFTDPKWPSMNLPEDADLVRKWAWMFRCFKHHNEQNRMLWVTTPGVDTSDYMEKDPRAQGESRSINQKLKDAGLVSGHAYTVLATFEDKEHDRLGPPGPTPLQLVLIRNPWGTGQGEWQGEWSDGHPLWSQYPRLRSVCDEKARLAAGEGFDAKKKEDGIFWMKWSDVRLYFDSGGVCLKHGSMSRSVPSADNHWQDVRFRTGFRDGQPRHFVHLRPSDRCKCVAFLQQHDRRGLALTDPLQKMCALRLDVITPTGDGKLHATVAQSNRGVFMYAHQVLALELNQQGQPPSDSEWWAQDDFGVDTFWLEKGRDYYFIVRQHPDEKELDPRSRDGIVLVIQTSPGVNDKQGIRGFQAYEADAILYETCKFKGYYGFAVTEKTRKACTAEDKHDEHYLPEGEDDQDEGVATHISVQLDTLSRVPGDPSASPRSGKRPLLGSGDADWPTSTRRWG